MADQINVGGIVADLDADPTKMVKGLGDARNAVAAIEAEMKRLDAEFKNAAISSVAYTDRTQKLGQALLDLEAAMKRAYDKLATSTSALDTVNAGMNRGAEGSKRLGGSLMQMSYIVDDLQYSLLACVNNIGPLVLTMTGSGGLGAVAQVAAVGVGQLAKNWDKLNDALGLGKVKTEAEEMAELGRQTKLTADEAERLERFKAVEGKVGDLRGAKTESQKKSEDIATKAITEAGHKNVAGGIMATMDRDKLDTDAGVQRAKAAERAILNAPVGSIDAKTGESTATEGQREARRREALDAKEAVIRAQREAVEKAAAAGTLTKFFPNGPGELAGLVKKAPEAFGRGNARLLNGLEEAQRAADETPEQRQQNKIKKDLAKPLGGLRKDFMKAVAKAAKDDADDAEKANDDDQRESDRRLRARKTAGKKAERELDQEKRDAAAAAEEKFPGISKDASLLALHAMGQRDPATALLGVNAKISQRLQELGVDPQSAEDASGVIAEKGKKDAKARVERRIDRDGVEEAEARDKPLRKNEVFGLSELTNRIQSAVGGDDEKAVRKKSLSRLDQMAESLANLEKRKTVEFKVTP